MRAILLSLVLAFSLQPSAFPAVTRINVGASANDMTGDRIRTALQIANTNFSTLDSQFGFVTNLLTVPNMAALRAMPATNTTTGYQLIGYLSANDGGGGTFYVDPLGIENDDLGTVITPNNNVGRIKRRLENTDVYPQWFGGLVNNATIQSAINYTSARGQGSIWITADYPIDPVTNKITMRSNCSLIGAPGGGLHFEGLQTASWALLTVPAGVTNASIANLKLRGRLETPGSTNNTGYLIDLGAVTNFTIGGIQARDWYTAYFSPLDGKAFENLQVFDANWLDTVLGYGAVADGFTDDTRAVQDAIHHKQLFNGKVFFPRTPNPFQLCSTWVTNGSVILSGDQAVIEQRYRNPTEGTLAHLSSIFTITAHNTVVEGFVLNQAGLFPTAETENNTGYCPAINVHLATNVVIRNNLFNQGTGKAISNGGGSYMQILNNRFVKSGITFGVGNRLDWLFNEATFPSRDGVYRSPLAPLVQGNTFIGSNPNKICVLFSASPDFKFLDNTMIDMDTPTGVIVAYSGDAGFTDANGTNIYNYPGLIRGNTISGSFGINGAIYVRINTPTSDYVQTGFVVTNMYSSIVIENNQIRGTGVGIELNAAPGTVVRNNDVRVTSSPLWWEGNSTGLVVDGGHYESTLAGLGNTLPSSESFLRPPIMKNMVIRNCRIVTPPGEEYAMRNVEPIHYENLAIENVTFDFSGAAGSGTPPCILQFTASTGFIKITDCTFNITNAMNKRTAVLMTGASADIEFSRNTIVAPAGVERRGVTLSGRKVRVHDNDVGRIDITQTPDLLLTRNYIPGYADSESPLVITTTGRAIITDNVITNNSTVAAICADIGVTNGVFANNTVSGNSSSDMVRSTLGRLLVHNNVILNAGAGYDYPTALGTGTLADTVEERALHIDMADQTGYGITLHRNGSPGTLGISQNNAFGASDRDTQYYVWPDEAIYHAGHAFYVHAAATATNAFIYGFGMNGSQQFILNGQLYFQTAGQGLHIIEGSNARMGTSTLSSGTVTIANTSIETNTRIFCFPKETGTYNGRLRVTARVAGTSFTVASSDAGDSVAFDWLLVGVAP